jgi:hypothetical protein
MEYRNSYVAFLDILGFKKLVFSNLESDKDKIEKYFKIIEDEIKNLKTTQIQEQINYIVISDSIIITVEQSEDKNNNIENLRQLCIAVGKIQYRLALNNLWLRGGISSGETYINQDDKQIVGKGYINAYQLEEKYATVPRVIIDNKIVYELDLESSDVLINEINKNEDQYLFVWNWHHNNAIKIEKDIPLFINYFHNINDNDLLNIMNNIQESIYVEIGLYKKFKWTADYLTSYLYYKERSSGRPMTYHGYINLLETL